MKPRLVIWGASGHALVVHDIVLLQGIYDLVAFLDDLQPPRPGATLCGVPIMWGRDQFAVLHASGARHLTPGFGDCAARYNAIQVAMTEGFELGTAVHPSAVVASGAALGPGTVVAAGAVINPASQIGRCVIVNTSASVDHECIVGDAAHICPGVHLGGRVAIGARTWVGIGSVVKEGVKIGSGSMIGAGSLVLTDIPDNVVAYGTPARVRRAAPPSQR